jgi:hypothetical protein
MTLKDLIKDYCDAKDALFRRVPEIEHTKNNEFDVIDCPVRMGKLGGYPVLCTLQGSLIQRLDREVCYQYQHIDGGILATIKEDPLCSWKEEETAYTHIFFPNLET